jgi:Flp pilus assembly protein TadG
MRRLSNERGAAAVEFALVLPLLLLLVLGIAEFGRAYDVQTRLSNAAREGVRVMALQNSATAARTAAKTAAGSITLTDANISVSPTTCVSTATATANATVVITYTLPYITGFFGRTITMQGRGVMRCGG